MRRWKNLAAVMAAVAALGGIAAGCSDSNTSEATTPANATTSANTAVQTDSKGGTVGATTEAPADTSQATDTAAPAAGGDAAAGKTTFDGTCQGCHPNGGNDAGVGPKLAGAGLTVDAVKKQVETPIGTMPAGLVSGDDLENVAAYVVSIQ